jgi:hypothetical protein
MVDAQINNISKSILAELIITVSTPDHQNCNGESSHLFSFSTSGPFNSQLSDRLLFLGCSCTDASKYRDVRSTSVQVSETSAYKMSEQHETLTNGWEIWTSQDVSEVSAAFEAEESSEMVTFYHTMCRHIPECLPFTNVMTPNLTNMIRFIGTFSQNLQLQFLS